VLCFSGRLRHRWLQCAGPKHSNDIDDDEDLSCFAAQRVLQPALLASVKPLVGKSAAAAAFPALVLT
jgi:hypothetical protein